MKETELNMNELSKVVSKFFVLVQTCKDIRLLLTSAFGSIYTKKYTGISFDIFECENSVLSTHYSRKYNKLSNAKTMLLIKIYENLSPFFLLVGDFV